MAEYLVRKAKYGTEIAKFEDSSYPLDVYSVSSSRCGCPARSRSCKHMKILKAWEADGRSHGAIYSDSAELLGNLFNGYTA